MGSSMSAFTEWVQTPKGGIRGAATNFLESATFGRITNPAAPWVDHTLPGWVVFYSAGLWGTCWDRPEDHVNTVVGVPRRFPRGHRGTHTASCGATMTPMQQRADDFLHSEAFSLLHLSNQMPVPAWLLLTPDCWLLHWLRPYMVPTGHIAISLAGTLAEIEARVRLAVGLP